MKLLIRLTIGTLKAFATSLLVSLSLRWIAQLRRHWRQLGKSLR